MASSHIKSIRSRWIALVLGACLLILLLSSADPTKTDSLRIEQSWTQYSGTKILLKINTDWPRQFRIRCDGDEIWRAFDKSGRVTLEVPGSCVHSSWIAGYPHMDSDGNVATIVEIQHDRKRVITLSLAQISALKKGGTGYSQLDL